MTGPETSQIVLHSEELVKIAGLGIIGLLGFIWGLLKTMVSDKLKDIKTAHAETKEKVEEHDTQIRELQLDTVDIRASLNANGCPVPERRPGWPMVERRNHG
jgi:hypothetical protein